MSNYSNSSIYKLCCNDASITDIYIGSTTNFRRRKFTHKSSCHNSKSQNYNQNVYQFIRENGGFNAFDMIEIERCNATDKRNIDIPVKDGNTTPNSTFNNNDFSTTKSKEELLIDSVKGRDNNTTKKYYSIGDVVIGDIVSYIGSNNETIYGIVFEIGFNNKIKMKTYPSPGQELIITDRFSWFKKIVN